jgi:hypothetical protein
VRWPASVAAEHPLQRREVGRSLQWREGGRRRHRRRGGGAAPAGHGESLDFGGDSGRGIEGRRGKVWAPRLERRFWLAKVGQREAEFGQQSVGVHFNLKLLKFNLKSWIKRPLKILLHFGRREGVLAKLTTLVRS